MMDREPLISVGLLEERKAVKLEIQGRFTGPDNVEMPTGRYLAQARETQVVCEGPRDFQGHSVELNPVAADADARFALTADVGHQFHWAEQEQQRFRGALRLAGGANGITVINDIRLEDYLTSVVCSEMAADCPLELIKAHSVISRSWLLAQRARASTDVLETLTSASPNSEGLRWYDQAAHTVFDVCAEDHCQRYHGIDRARTPQVFEAIAATRGQVLTFEDAVCDTRYSKCCGGLTEDARTAWSDAEVPYLVSFYDGPKGENAPEAVSEEGSFQHFLEHPPAAFCQCDDRAVLEAILPERDRRTTPQFFRWTERLGQQQVQDLVREKLGQQTGPIKDLVALERGPSGRIWKLALVGFDRTVVIGKELEIRRVLSSTHLLSSAFAVERIGDRPVPDAFVLHGAGWGHGVGLCQIGAAVMAVEGYDYRQILAHYYPGTVITAAYT